MAGKLIDTKLGAFGLLIANKPTQGEGPLLELINPKDGSTITTKVHEASAADVDRAVDEAEKAFEGPWAAYTGQKRADCLNKFADLLDAHAEEISYLESVCSGRPLGMVIGELPRVSAVFRYYAGWADKIRGDSYPPEDGFYKIVRQEPLGVCAGITAWNGSLHFFAWKSAPALACGNTVILKPSEKSPLGSLAASYLIEAAGFPPGVFQVIAGGGRVGGLLSSHMKIAKISFTGSTATGRKIQEAATKSNLKRVTLELGGKSPAIVFDDADMETALFWSVLGITINSGQVCAATSRIYLQEDIAEAFLARMKEQFTAIASAMGADPQEKTTTYGPLVDRAQYDKVWNSIQSGKRAATLLTGGDEYTKGGHYVAPTIFLEPDKDADIYREEIFGPVLCARTFKTEEEALVMANDTHYGLAGSIYTNDLKRALRVSAKLRGGTISINCSAMVGPQVPMGGFGCSGIGRELGEYALRHYTEPKAIWIK
ncbi:aldehyde dehydrogenase [Phialemonium atrogriseum]|uniref:aldehyde dehydrogenase (NAD(+)) n=1 Tax=Phialemonium atrogriseum TaxID=1093897 RepID=A0AAJ0BSV8_9PEZI|nr:aldehyde dehydrogenase [Phialemonium atrogriseum]KAK1762783.1 aldehyde dehydrogenase [Phialemonium atrogriseum]